MRIKKYLAGAIGTNCYLVINEKIKHGVIVDPASCPEQMKEYVNSEGIQIDAVLLTHAHFDHIMGIDEVLKTFGKKDVYVHADDKVMLENPVLNMSEAYGSGYSYREAVSIRDRQVLELIGYRFLVFHTPGHTPGSVCYYLEDEEILLSGDTLFRDSVGRTDFPGGSMSSLVRSVREKLLVLSDETVVYPGHMGTTTIGHEKEYNPFL